MIRSLIGKELAEHWVSMLLIGLLLGFGFATVLTNVMFASDNSRPFEALRMFLLFFVLLTTLILGNRLVVREYQSKTQLFLEALPLTRLGMITTKYILGLTIVLAATIIAFALVASLSARMDDINLRFASIVLSKACSFTIFLFSFFFMMGLLGRYRIAIYILLALACAMLETFTDIELKRLGPFALMDNRFAFERDMFPVSELLITWAMIGGFLTLIGMLAAMREGNVASMLAEKMSHREKVFITCLILGFSFLGTVLDSRKQKDPYDLPGALTASSGSVTAKVGLGRRGQSHSQATADAIASELEEFCEFLDIKEIPTVFLVQRTDLDADQYERGEISNAEGILVRANFHSSDWQQEDFLCHLLAEVVAATTEDRTMAEPVRWVLDGLPYYWADEKGYTFSNATPIRRDTRVAMTMRDGFGQEELRDWFQFRERVGDDIASSMAWNGLAAIRDAKGAAATQQFLRRVLNTNVPSDIRATLYAWSNSASKAAKSEVDLTEDELLTLWTDRATRLMSERAEELELIPKMKATVTFPAVSEGSRSVEYEFECSPPPTDGNFSILYADLTAFDSPLGVGDEQVEQLQYDSHRSGKLDETLSRRSRWMYTFSVYAEVLGCDIITGWRREQLP